MLTYMGLLVGAGVLFLLAAAMGYVLGWANRRFHVEVDPRVEAALAALAGANCGACGFVGCAEYAKAVVEGDAAVDLCAPGGASCARKLAEIVGVELERTFPYRAVVHCSAHTEDRLQRSPYQGEQTCAAANLVADVQGCSYGCLGLGDCERACGYGAIRVIDGLATVDYEKCVGCRACARACPRNIITMVPFKSDRMVVVACSNEDSAGDVRAVCKVGCLGCRACSKLDPEVVHMQGALPVIDYDRYDPEDPAMRQVMEKCPRKRIVSVGQPTERDLAAVAAEELPEEVKPDFQTTVDDTKWRG